MFFNIFTYLVFFFFTKEFLFYGEERMIVISYLTLFVLLFFVLSSGFNEDFKYRADLIKEEFDSFFSTVLELLDQTKSLVLKFSFLVVSFVRIVNGIFQEYLNFSMLYFNFSFFKRKFFFLKFNEMLDVSVRFFFNSKHLIFYTFFKVFLKKLLLSKFNSLKVDNVSLGKSGELLIKGSSNNFEGVVAGSSYKNFWFVSSSSFKLPSDSSFRYNFGVNNLNYNFYHHL